jgi:hypothetical protein
MTGMTGVTGMTGRSAGLTLRWDGFGAAPTARAPLIVESLDVVQPSRLTVPDGRPAHKR